MIRLSLHPSPASETSAFNKIRALSSRRAGLFPFRISVSSCWRSSPLNLTTYLFTGISFAAMIASVASSGDESESPNPFKLVEAGRLALIQERDVGALADAAGEIEHVPVGQADAAVRLGLADLRRIRRAVDAVARLRQVDPHDADRVVGPRPDRKGPVGLDLLEAESGVVAVGRLLDHLAHAVAPARRRLLIAADRRRIKGDERAVAVERTHGPAGFVDFDPRHGSVAAGIDDVGNDDDGAGAVERPPRVELLQQAFVDVKFFREQLRRTGVIEMLEMRHVFHAARDARHERTLHVVVGYLVFDE